MSTKPSTAVPARRWLSQSPSAANKVQIDRVLGHTCVSSGSLAYNPAVSSEFAYIAGSVVVLYDQRTHSQRRFFLGRRGHELNCVSWSADGTWLAAGESGVNGAVLLFDVSSGQRIATLLGHTDTVTHIKFSPFRDYLTVVNIEAATSSQEPRRTSVCVWKTEEKQLAWSHTFTETDFPASSSDSSRISDPASRPPLITALDWSCDNTYFVIAGNRYLSYYYVRAASVSSFAANLPSGSPMAKSAAGGVTFEKHDAKLGVHDNAEFVGVVCGSGSLAVYTFCLSNKGMLCAFTLKEKKKKAADADANPLSPPVNVSTTALGGKRWEIEKWVDLRLSEASSLSLVNGILSMSGADAKVRVFEASKLEHLATLPKPAPLLADKKKYAAASLCVLSPDSLKVAVVYSDRTLVVWDIQNPKKKACSPFRTITAHSDQVWDIKVIPEPQSNVVKRRAFHDIDYDSDEDAREQARVDSHRRYPPGSFLSCGADHSIRIWNFDPAHTSAAKDPSVNECMASVYVAPSVTPGATPMTSSALRSIAFIPPDSTAPIVSASTPLPSNAPLTSYPHGVIVSGDELGTLRFHNMTDLKVVSEMEAHDREVRCLSFHQQKRTTAGGGGAVLQVADLPLLASGSRDCVVHLHNVNTPSKPQTLTPEVIHSAAVTQVHIAALPNNDDANAHQQLILISTSVDKTLAIRSITPDSPAPLSLSSIDLEVGGPSTTAQSQFQQLLFQHSHVLDIALHPTRKFMAILCNNIEKKKQAESNAAGAAMASKPVNCYIKMIDLATMKESRTYSIQTLGNGEPIKMSLDPSGILLAISFSDKSVLLLDWYSGGVLTSFYAHSRLVTSLAFTNNCKHLLTASKDGCIIAWKLDEQYVKAMLARKKELEPKSESSATKKKNGATLAGGARSTAMDYLSDSEGDEEDEDEEESTAAVPATAAGGAALPPLTEFNSGELKIVGKSDYKPKTLPTWARSTVVTQDSDPNSSNRAGSNFPSGVGIGVERSNSQSVSKSRWASRVEVDEKGQPIVADGNKVYGEMGTIGIGTILVDPDSIHSSPAHTSAVASAPSNEVIGIEMEGASELVPGVDDVEELEVDDMDDSDEFLRDPSEPKPSASNTNAAPSTSNVKESPSFLRSSLTSQFFQKLKEEGKLNVSGSLPSSSSSSVVSSLPIRQLGLPSSFVEREQETTREVAQVRQQIRSMGIIEQNATHGHEPHAPAPSVSPNTSVVLSSSDNNHGSIAPPAASKSPLPNARALAVHTGSSVHASLLNLPSAAQNLSTHRETIEAFQHSLQNLLCAFGQVKQAQVAARPGSESGAGVQSNSVPSVAVSFARGDSSSDNPVAVIPILSSHGANARSTQLALSSHAHPSSVAFPSVAASAIGLPTAAAHTDLDTLAGVYEDQLKAMQSVLSQLLPSSPTPSVSTDEAPPAGLRQLMPPARHPSHVLPSPTSSTFLTQGPASPTNVMPDPLALSHTHSQILQSMDADSIVYDRMSERLADMVLRKLEAKVNMGTTGLLSTTQQLALGVTLTQPNAPIEEKQ